MKTADYQFLSAFLQDSSGLSLGEGKEYLLESRLVPLAQSWGLPDFDDLVHALRSKRDRQLAFAVTEAMTTNETLFFRDKTPFEDLKREILPQLRQGRLKERNLRIWCAAASTGQEPYSVLMLLAESFRELLDWKLEFLATDIAEKVLARAREGIYSQFEIQRGLPIQYVIKYFEQCGAEYQIKPALRSKITFRTLNLLEDFRRNGPFDIILCRNVLIYFDVETKRRILERMKAILRPDGFLMLGAAESIIGITSTFERFRACQSAVYKPVL